MAKASDNEFPSILIAEGTTPATPAAGNHRLFVDSADGLLKRVDDGGSVSTVEGGGGGALAAWSSFTPTVSAFTLGNGTLTAAYLQDGKNVYVRIYLLLGSTSSFSGTSTFTVPVAEKVGTVQALAAGAFDSSASKLFGLSASVGAGAGVIHTMCGTSGATSASVPFAWATGDYLFVTGVYEAN